MTAPSEDTVGVARKRLKRQEEAANRMATYAVDIDGINAVGETTAGLIRKLAYWHVREVEAVETRVRAECAAKVRSVSIEESKELRFKTAPRLKADILDALEAP